MVLGFKRRMTALRNGGLKNLLDRMALVLRPAGPAYAKGEYPILLTQYAAHMSGYNNSNNIMIKADKPAEGRK